MAINKPILIRTSSNTTSRLTGRVVDLSNNTLIQSPTVPTSDNPAGGQSQPPAGFNGPVPDALTGKLPERATAGSVTSSNADRQAAVNDKLGLADKASVIDALLGRGGDQGNGGGHPLTDLMGSTPTNGLPGMDQGFGPSPDGATLAAMFGGGSIGSAGDVAGSSEVATLTGASAAQGSTSATRAQGGGSRVMNPMAPFQGGSVSGPLGELASSQKKSLSDFDKSGLMADGDLAPSPMSTVGAGAATASAAAATSNPATALVTALQGGGAATTLGGSSLTGIVAGGAGAMATAVAGVAGAFTVGAAIGSAFNYVFTALAGESIGDKIYDGTHPDENIPATKPATGGGVGQPDPENQGVQVSILSGSILDQLRAAQAGKPTSQGGSSDATPVDDGGLGGVVRDGFIAVNQSSVDGRNLFGQPVGSGGENISGGNKGLNGFGNSNGAGVINPGPDGGTPQGDARFAEDPGSALGGRQTSPNLGGGRNAGGDNGGSSSQAEDLVLNGTTGADTLRGLGGNDTLRGLAGRDILDGGAGRDQLTGGTGADRFRFSAGSSFGLANADRITDFNRAHGDRIEISRQAFSLAAGTSVSFQSVNTDQSLNQALAGGSLFVHD
ncbi:MAG: calcium-binding protein, partial [Chitinophagaceae bacterium]|nr:calcium-binding protein [Chitinophagaceae bacterium]